MSARIFVNTDSTLLVQVFEGHSTAEVARRPDSDATWGPPTTLKEQIQPGYLADPVEVVYTNQRGEERVRRILPISTYFGSTDYHPEPQWLLRCWDVEKQALRDYALANCDFVSPGA